MTTKTATKVNPHIGSDCDAFLPEEGAYEGCESSSHGSAIARGCFLVGLALRADGVRHLTQATEAPVASTAAVFVFGHGGTQ
jgi:hypothetical protein